MAECTTLFSYRSGRDLTGYQDGSANPEGEDAWAAALIPEGDWAQGSFALVQRYLHFRDRFATLPPPSQDHVIGRRIEDDAEIGEAPIAAHIKRTEQEGFDPPAFVLRRSMPWGDTRRHGLQFMAFSSHLDKVQRLLSRMMGLADPVQDAILGHTQAETGALYFIHPVLNGRLKLPEAHFEAQGLPSTAEVAASDTVRLIVDSARCIHSRNCVLARPDVFVPNVQGPWLHPELADANEIAEIAHQCPSGAIQYERLDGGPAEQPPHRNVIRLRENGPLAIHGEFAVAGDNRIRATLCRCGQSRRKPYCDGSHNTTHFEASGEREALAESATELSREPILIQPIADGPLVVHGAVEIVTGTGKTISRAAGPTLCRCGGSGNKPFCDGSHARVGFKAPK
jgi:CDGSH-type Zn-finger protein/uncharacterized Fe-S cluster protein YjdI